MARQPLLSLESYVSDHMEFYSSTSEYLLKAWGQGKLTIVELKRMLQRSVAHGYAVNMYSRIAHAKIAANLFEELLAEHPNREFFKIDLVCRDFIFNVEEGRDFDVGRLKRWVKSLLNDIDYLGGIDVAFYLAGSFSGRRGAQLSWHAHVIAWDTSEQHLKTLKKVAEARFTAGRDNAEVFRYRKLARSKVVGRAMYAIKSPMSQYSVCTTKDRVDDATGEVSEGVEIQNKDALGPDKRIEIVKALGSRGIPDLVIAGGKGKKRRRALVVQGWFSTAGEEAYRQSARLKLLGLPPLFL